MHDLICAVYSKEIMLPVKDGKGTYKATVRKRFIEFQQLRDSLIFSDRMYMDQMCKLPRFQRPFPRAMHFLDVVREYTFVIAPLWVALFPAQFSCVCSLSATVDQYRI
jgi:hypothetical protein